MDARAQPRLLSGTRMSGSEAGLYSWLWRRQVNNRAVASSNSGGVGAGNASSASGSKSPPRWWPRRAAFMETATASLRTMVTGAAEAGPTAGSRSGRPSHLVVMVNGLSGAPSNWDYLCEQLQERLPPEIASDLLLHRWGAGWAAPAAVSVCCSPASCAISAAA